MTSVLKRAGGVLAVAAMALPAVTALAQTNVPPKPPYEEHRVPPQHFGPDGRMDTPGESLGQGQPQGVMPPPATGDQNVIQPKNQSRTPTPEIPPPGTPGGNPNVQPK